MTETRLREIREIVNRYRAFNRDVILEILADRDALAAELDDWRSGKLRLAPLKPAAAATNTHKEDLR